MLQCIRSFSQIPAEEIIKKCLNNLRRQYRHDRTSGFCSEKAQKTATCFHDEKSTQPSIVLTNCRSEKPYAIAILDHFCPNPSDVLVCGICYA